jgi:EpsI family protein
MDVEGHLLEVVRSCSGIRSIMALGTLAAALGMWRRLPLAKLALLVLLAAPAALAGNTVRLVITALLVLRFGPAAAEGRVHEAVGVVSFGVSLLLLGLAVRALRGAAGPASTRRPARRSPRLVLSRALGWFLTLRVVSLRAAWAALALVGIAGAWGIALERLAVAPGPVPRLAALPFVLDDLHGADIAIDDRVQDQVQPDAWLFRSYAAPSGPDLALYVGYYVDPRQGAQIHSPLHCYPGAGWRIERSEPILVRDLHGRTSEMRRLLVGRQGQTDVVIYWYEARTGRLTSDVRLKLELVRAALLHRPRDAAFVRWSTPLGPEESVEDATQRLLAAAARAFPHLEAALPFGG